MSPSYKARLLKDVAQSFASQLRGYPDHTLRIFKRFCKLEKHRLRMRHRAGAQGLEIVHQYSDLVDVLFLELLEKFLPSQSDSHLSPSPVAIVALGGYGRQEMNPYSDVDVMFLLAAGKPCLELEDGLRKILLTLWDLGFKIGHSTRSIAQAIELANHDLITKTALLESRFLCGNPEIFQTFTQQFTQHCLYNKANEYIQWRLAYQHKMRAKLGSSIFMQEPHIKNGRGGLRDYQSLLWITSIQEQSEAFLASSNTADTPNTTASPSLAQASVTSLALEWPSHPPSSPLPLLGHLSLDQLVEKNILMKEEKSKLTKAYDFLLRVRTEMHYQNRCAMDTLTLQLQGQIATAFHYPQRGILRRCEAFMRDYYRHALAIDRITDAAITRCHFTPDPAISPNTPSLLHSPSPLPISSPEVTSILSIEHQKSYDGFLFSLDTLNAEHEGLFQQDPFRLLRAFQYAQEKNLKFSRDLQDLLQHEARRINRTFQYARTGREIFLSILSHKGNVGPFLRKMHELGILGKYLPEFRALTCLVQHEFFHRYTADEHTLVCLEKLDAIFFTEDPKFSGYRLLFQKLEDPAILYLALLLHDTGKANHNAPHEEHSTLLAHRVARRLQLSPERRRMLLLLVDSHYTLSHTAQTRNIEDIATITEFAKIIGTRANLDALMLLTLADGMGTCDQNWSDWKENLVWRLYRKTKEYLEAGPEPLELRQKNRTQLKEQACQALSEDFYPEIDVHFEDMPERYFQEFQIEEIIIHLQLFRTFFRQFLYHTQPPWMPAIQWTSHPQGGYTEVIFCGWDRPRLLERLAGAFVSTHLNIMSADVFSRGDNLALDIFRVCNTDQSPISDPDQIQQVTQRVQVSLHQEDYDFTPLIYRKTFIPRYRISQETQLETRVVIDNLAHPMYSIVEIQAPDRMGFLYSLLRTFSTFGTSIALARITTQMEVVMDTFYVTDIAGKKLEDRLQMEKLQMLLQGLN